MTFVTKLTFHSGDRAVLPETVDDLKDDREELVDELEEKRGEYESHGEDLEEAK
mgnify:CR=1 FL=1